MQRRTFLKSVALAGLLWGLPASSCVRAKARDPHDMSLAELRRSLADGTLSGAQLWQHYQDRISQYEPLLHSIIELAEASDSSPTTGPLAQLPLLVKDNIATGDGLVNSAGSLALAGSRPTFAAGVIERLRAAGALVIGKSNMSEWANFRAVNASSGWSARGGQCRNPHVLDRSPCGSSSGSAAAVAAGLCAAALGTETNGSIVCPSATCGVVGLKPTVGLVPGDGIIPICHSQDSAGPITRRVEDAALLLGVMVGKDYSQSLDKQALKGARLGVARAFFGFDSRVDQLIEAQLELLSQMGAELIDPVEVPGWPELGGAAMTVMLYEFKHGLNAYLERLGKEAPVKSLAEVIAFNSTHPEQERLTYFDQTLLLRAESCGPLTDKEYLKARDQARRLSRDQGLDRVLNKHKLDALVAPTNGPAWTIDVVNGDHFEGGSSTPAAVAGYPHITVPAGTVHRLPIGLSFFGKAESEGRLLALAYAFEQHTRARIEPEFLPSLPIF